jgi:hypothetical protein
VYTEHIASSLKPENNHINILVPFQLCRQILQFYIFLKSAVGSDFMEMKCQISIGCYFIAN